MRIAVVGAGVSGAVAARLLASQHEVELYEAATHVGGHAHTVDVSVYGQRVPVDVAFMVFNDRTYPNFCRILDWLNVASRDSDMSFSFRCDRNGLEYQGGSLRGLFAQRVNCVRPRFWSMLRDIVRFNRAARQYARGASDHLLLGEFLDQIGVGSEFEEHYLLPMGAAIWSTEPAALRQFPAKFILGFFDNHGLIQLRDRPQWKTIVGGSRNYVASLLRGLDGHVHVGCRVRQVNRDQQGVTLSFDDRPAQRFDHVVLATHADRTLQLLQSPTPLEQHLLACFPYQENHAVLHTDRSLLPRRRAAWASWNYHRPAESTDNVSVTYDLNRLQGLNLPGPLCLTLNPTQSIDPAHQIMDFDFAHPVFSLQSVVAQRRWAEISGPKQTHFCGAYWGYGFHEDGANSGIAVARALGIDVETVLGRSSDIAIDPRRHKPVVVHPHAPALQRTRPRSVSSSSILPAQLKER